MRRCTDDLTRERNRSALPLEGRMDDIEWKPLPTGLWTPPAVFAEVGNLLLEAFTHGGVPTWEISKKTEEQANGTSSPRALPTPSRRPKRRRFSKGEQHHENHKGHEIQDRPVVGVVGPEEMENGTGSHKKSRDPSANQGVINRDIPLAQNRSLPASPQQS